MNNEGLWHVRVLLARGCDRCMHAAIHLVGKHWPGLYYGDLDIWQSTDPAVVMLRERYTALNESLKQTYILEGIDE